VVPWAPSVRPLAGSAGWMAVGKFWLARRPCGARDGADPVTNPYRDANFPYLFETWRINA
jgi:hypothetical protein